ncbi:MAG: polyprenyl synthetase family protein, partial [Mesorhizobium sp.]
MLKDDQVAFESALFTRAAAVEVLLRQVFDAPLLSGEIARPERLMAAMR